MAAWKKYVSQSNNGGHCARARSTSRFRLSEFVYFSSTVRVCESCPIGNSIRIESELLVLVYGGDCANVSVNFLPKCAVVLFGGSAIVRCPIGEISPIVCVIGIQIESRKVYTFQLKCSLFHRINSLGCGVCLNEI